MKIDENLTRDILDSISEGLFTVDKDFKINFMNRAAENILGKPREEAIGRFCKQICRSDMCLSRCPIAVVLQKGENVHDMEGRIRSKSGEIMYIKINAAVLRGRSGEPVGGVVSFRDVTLIESMKRHIDRDGSFYGIVAHNKKMLEIFELIEEIADSDAAVLIQGESGTGKEMVANAVQLTGVRKEKPFIKVNCSVFSPQLLASELFGYVRGAFTGAVKDRQGRFEVADGGTIFLDEVGEMSPEMQLQLLRVLQEGTFERVGESVTRTTDIRIIAATNKDLEQELSHGKFRRDLFYRLNVIPIQVPPLRERIEDIPYLVNHFLEKFSGIYNKNITEIEDAALDLLIGYPWPGNVRELENALEYAFVRTRNEGTVREGKLPATLRMPTSRFAVRSVVNSANGEAIHLLDLLEKHHWNRTRVAKILGIGRTTLWRKLKQYHIDIPA